MDTQVFDQLPLFEALDQDHREILSKHFVLRHFPKNTIVIYEGDDTNSLYVILEGKVKVFLADEAGKEIVLNTQGTGEYFGEVSLFDEGQRSASVITTEECQFAVLMKQDFMDCLTENPRMSFKIIQGLTQRLRALSENVRSLALMDVYGRVARLLLELAEEQGDSQIIPRKLTYNDIAERVGASPKMVSRVMQELKKGGYIRKADGQLIIEHTIPDAW
jgi:CRP/FNR family cyclic AMP-dependent transcriptional regulator